MDFVYELLRAGTTQANSDSGAEVARKINDNFKKVQDKFLEIDQSIKDGVPVDIPTGTTGKAGVVKSSSDENKILIDKDGTMEITSLNVKKLVQSEDDYIILDGDI